MALPCSNAGCGQRFDPQRNSPDSCVYHPGVPIFHDALKGWSCCRKRTTDFSEFLAIKGCTTGYHSKEKPPEPVSQEETSDKPKAKPAVELIIQGPASAEKMRERRRPAPPLLIGAAALLEGAGLPAGRSRGRAAPPLLVPQIYQGPDSNAGTCTFHPGVPVFHEGMKYWSCCAVRTTDFGAFLEQPGCSTGRHCWADKGDKKAVSCRQDWHQTSSHVVVTVYARNPLPALSTVKANRTVLEVHIVFEGNKIFQAELDLWGVIDTEKSFVSMVPTKVEITLSKASPVPWGRLELPQSRSHSRGEQVEKDIANVEEPVEAQGDDSDDSLSWSEDEDEEMEMGTPSN
uniref:Integrin subunit beta 1 binding protein 2 n=1 Tax=Apteryx owenii TaxID=8824 RepID=A0A8B9QEX9_APTOW